MSDTVNALLKSVSSINWAIGPGRKLKIDMFNFLSRCKTGTY